MNKLLSYLTIMIVFMGVILTSCGKEDEPNGGKYDDPSVPTEFTPNEESISYFTDGLVFSAEGGSVEINFTTNKMWSTNLSYTDGGRDWLSISQNQTQGQVVLTASTNATPTPRMAVLTIAAGGNNNYIKITQNSTSTVVLHVETAGTLDRLLPANGRDQITSLTLSGELNGSDIKVIRSLFHWGSDNFSNNPLDYLNLENATIVSGGQEYYNASMMGVDCTTHDFEIGPFMFFGYNGHTLLLPSNTLSLGYQAISSCNNISQFELPKTLQIIDKYAIGNCPKLSLSCLPNNLKRIGTMAIYNCPEIDIETLSLPEGLEYLGINPFSFPKLKYLKIPSGVSMGEDNPFGCILSRDATPNLETLIIESKFEECELFSLGDMPSLKHVELSCKKIYGISNCENLETLIFNEGVTDIGLFTGMQCPQLKTVYIPSTVDKLFVWCLLSNGPGSKSTVKDLHLASRSIPWEECDVNSVRPYGYQIENDVFKNTTLYIPRGSMANYAPIKDCFKSIIEE